MNTSKVSNNLPQGVTRPTQDVPVVPDDSEDMPGSEDITVRRDIPQRSPNHKAHAFTAGTPFKHLLAGVMLASVVGCGTTSGDRMVSADQSACSCTRPIPIVWRRGSAGQPLRAASGFLLR